MKGYKALDMDMKAMYGNRMQYEMNKLYSIEGRVVLCENGFHFCKEIERLEGYYPINNSRIFEVKASGKIVQHYGKYVAEKIKLVRELTKEEINDYFKQNQKKFIESEDSDIRKTVAGQGYGLDILINDENWMVRQAVARQGYGLNKLVYDQAANVRIAVAKQGYGLDKLINDENCYVRIAVAKQGYGLDKLVNDKHWVVRVAVAEQGYGLDRLVNDKNWGVREAVAEQGYGLDILINDKDKNVRETAQEILNRQ